MLLRHWICGRSCVISQENCRISEVINYLGDGECSRFIEGYGFFTRERALHLFYRLFFCQGIFEYHNIPFESIVRFRTLRSVFSFYEAKKV